MEYGFCEKPERIVNITIDNFDGGFQVGSFFKRAGHKRAKIAIEKLEELRENKDTETTIVLPVRLVERDSTAVVK